MNKIKKLALGTAQFGLPYGISNKNGQVSQYDASQILIKAKSVGIGVLDTAIAYGDSEQILGKCDLNDFKIISKLPDFKEYKKELGTWFERQLSTSFSRLDVKNIDGLLLHRPEQLLLSMVTIYMHYCRKLKPMERLIELVCLYMIQVKFRNVLTSSNLI